ncbi:hypothetical protein GGI26_004178 [Coemansia sp. RSA 1358]|nr:hypothetical protein BX070DRAFT_13941 [Coemansia spiralis]KAJ2621396.1 hypothetical protein GGI26_004178 [Coemansia sp. RSA 1358]
MHINELPSSVIEHIIDYASTVDNTSAVTVGEWINKLKYATVCTQWRWYLSPVYTTAILECQCSSETSGGYRWLTNIDLLVQLDLCAIATDLVIILPQDSNCVSVREALERFGFGKHSWDSVVSLKVLISKETDEHVCVEAQNGMHWAQRLAKYLYTHVPHIFTIRYPEITGKWLRAFHLLFTAYSQQLVNYCNPNSVSFIGTAALPNITVLSIRAPDSIYFSLPQLNNMAIRRLKLSNLPHAFSWHRIVQSSSRSVEFVCLEVLDLEFALPQNSQDNSAYMTLLNTDKCVYDIALPMLKSLWIVNVPQTSRLLYSTLTLPGLVHNIKITGAFSGVEMADNIKFYMADSFIIRVDGMAKSNTADFNELSRNLFGRFSVATDMKLILDCRGWEPNIEEIEWFNLTHLALASAQVCFVVELLRQLPSLIVFYFGWPMQHRRLPELKNPINTVLDALCVYAEDGFPLETFDMSVVVFMATAFAMVGRFFVPEMHVEDVQDEFSRLVNRGEMAVLSNKGFIKKYFNNIGAF